MFCFLEIKVRYYKNELKELKLINSQLKKNKEYRFQ